MNYTLTAKLKRVEDVQEINDRYSKRMFVVETDERYPQVVEFQLSNDKTCLIDEFQTGQEINVWFKVGGREWKKDASSPIRVFNTLEAWRIDKAP